MATLNSKQVLSNLYGLMMEINYYRPDKEILEELEQKPDAQLDAHLVKIKQLNAKLKAQANQERFQKAVDQIKVLKEKGLEELKRLISPQEQAQLVPLFRKFDELTEKDEAAIGEDQELLHLIEILKNKLDEDSK
ncbi:MAG: hypothetical protein JSU01_19880 [Bacteroidetes bacterium]|nr:hypothetical protein [Bacteroidota bacterium]